MKTESGPKLKIEGSEIVDNITYARCGERIVLTISTDNQTVALDMLWRDANKMGERLIKYAEVCREYAKRH